MEPKTFFRYFYKRMRLVIKDSVWLLFVLVVFSSTCWGQQLPEETYQFYHLTPDDGLSQVSIEAMLHDARGYLWVGTQDGLNRYDGHRFRIFKHRPSDSTSVSGNSISCLHEDRFGRIWVGTDNRGLSVYLPQEDRFVVVPLGESLSTSVTAIKQGNKDEIWIGTRHSGLHRVSLEEGSRPASIRIDEENPELNSITALEDLGKEQLLLGKDGSVLELTIQDSSHSLRTLPTPGLQGVVKAFEVEGEKVWIGTENSLYLFNRAKYRGQIQDLQRPAGESQSRPYEINDLHLDDQYRLWIAAGHGLIQLSDWNPVSTRFETNRTYQHDINDQSTLSHSSVLSLSIDSRQIYIGTSRYLNLLQSKPKFNIVRRAPKAGTSINNNIVFSFFKDEPSGDLWVGTSGGGLNLYRGDNYYYFTESNDVNSISDNIIRGIEKDSDNNLWLATTKGLSLLNLNTFSPEKPSFQTYISDFSADGLAHNNLRDVLFHDGQIWIISAGGGLSRFIGDISQGNFSFQTFRYDPDDENSLNADFIHAIIPGLEPRSYWLGTENGLCHMAFSSSDYSTPVFNRFRTEVNNSTSLPDNAVYDLAFDQAGELWIGTSYGLASYNSSTHEFKRYYTEDGLAGNVIYSVQPDELGQLWIGTNNGLSVLNPSNGYFRSYDESEGLQDREFNIKSKLIDSEGNIYLGGISGFNTFNPIDFVDSNTPLPVYVENILVEELNRNGSLRIPFANGKIEISHKSFPLHIGFSAPDADPLRTIQYEYMLEPLRNTWNNLGDQNRISFPDLAPGEYYLKIRGKEGGLAWNAEPTSLVIDVSPPWWRSAWAYVIYSLLFVSIAYTFYRYQLQRKLAREESRRLKELDLIKNKLYTNITHEFRTPLTVILGLLNEIKEKRPVNIQDDAFLSVIEKNSNNLLTLVNQLLDLSKLEQDKETPNYSHGDIIVFIDQVVSNFQTLAKRNSISLIFYTEVDSFKMDFDEQRVNQILGNLLSNAIKFCSGQDEIVVHTKVNQTEQNFILKVKDTGPGILESDLPHIFDRYFQVGDSQNRFGGGSGIGLALTKELVELMDGQLLVDSIKGGGTTFTIELPVRTVAPPSVSAVRVEQVEPGVVMEGVADSVHDPDKPLVLVIEDNSDVAFYLQQCLSPQFNTHHEANGQLGIDYAVEAIPDIIISDIMMPEKDGFQVCESLKNDIRTNHVPIVLLTAKTQEQDKISGFKSGADVYLTKPFSKEELLVRMEQLMLVRQKLKEKYQASFSYLPAHKSQAAQRLDPNDDFIQKVVNIILEYLDDPLMKGPFLAKKTGLSESQLYRKLKALTGKSTALFIRYIRINKAHQMLSEDDLNVSEVAYACGFSDPAWFSRVFKEEFGVPPSDV